MEELHKDIKRRVDECYKQIKDAQKELERIREKECPHPKTEIVDYSYRIGSSIETEVCSICGEVINSPYNSFKINDK